MISLKSKLLNATLAVTAAIPLATTVFFTSAGSAQAAALTTGGFSLLPQNTVTLSATLQGNSLSFDLPNTFLIPTSTTSGDFTNFSKGSIGPNISFNSTNELLSASNPFLTLIDQVNNTNATFTVTSATYKASQALSSNLIDIFVVTNGFFTTALGEISQGEGIITLQTNGTVANLQDNLKLGKAVTTTYSSSYFATVPEPTTMLGLGLVGAGMVMSISRRRKSILQ
ncbi:PEP-CTERM sorting domain-containing protein [Nostoc sp. CCCryo 231-06]|nr:PEP-CTERM sorting domain-containing protein [Nostoc sp. CCCryo 231-06]